MIYTSVISTQGIFSPYSFLVILLLERQSNFIVSALQISNYYPVFYLKRTPASFFINICFY